MKRELGIARCGLACCLCSENITCKGCKRDGFKELSWCKDAEWCEVRRCGIDKDINGCYECEPANCRKGLYADKIKARAFAEFARRYGVEALLDCLERNEKAGVVYHREGIMGDYDEFDDLEELIDFIKTGKKSIRTNYEKWYEGDTYYWGTEPGRFLEELIELCPPSADKKVLDIGCGEGKDAVYMAQKGYDVTAFDLTENGIRKTKALAEKRNVNVSAYVDDINTFSTDEQFDIIYSTGTVQYLFEENKKLFFEKLEKITRKNGIVYINVFVEKPFLELPPDWDKEEKMWKSGELFTYFADWKVERIDEVIFEDNSGGVPHYHCMDTIICRKVTG